MASDPLQEALLRLADGDRSAFDTVYEAVAPRVLALCRRRLRDPVLAEDIAQDAMVKVFTHAEAYDPACGGPLPWALGVAGWECRSAIQRRARSREDDAPIDAHDPGASPEQHAIAADLLADVEDVLGHMSALDRETLLAVWSDGPRPPLSAATFRKRLQRAMARFRARWSPDEA